MIITDKIMVLYKGLITAVLLVYTYSNINSLYFKMYCLLITGHTRQNCLWISAEDLVFLSFPSRVEKTSALVYLSCFPGKGFASLEGFSNVLSSYMP